ncbi:polysaccharide deacetylase family protein [Noviherbaspirillum galbum]|uniref:Polysaccharide deacetylase family protein n=1 Tax=Noviherbaspirillum galbum TaxID=2709383 RepID=A0A6B3SU41_9BURK|nr:polysaccharide deacetylase family protein [Noviherbaspirillum galbum]NEX62885.1 polysaccharide deacetylase family protein [Noviherbaspirillum galbum]
MSQPFPILLYHRLDRAGLSTSTAPEVFYSHLAALREEGWRTLTCDEFSYYLEADKEPPPRTFLITFDDGYESVHGEALGLLRALDYSAIAFIATALIRHDDALTGDEERDKFMTWDQVRSLQESGVIDCQSHGHLHANFTGQPLSAVREDLDTSVRLLASELRLPASHVRHLAWPWGLSRPEWRAIAQESGLRFQYGVSRQSYRNGMALDAIPRTCFDASPFKNFQRQFWLQTGSIAPLWDVAYPLGRTLRGIARAGRVG